MAINKEKIGISYPAKTYKLSPQIIKELDTLRLEENTTYNVLFRELIKGYKMNKILNANYYEVNKLKK